MPPRRNPRHNPYNETPIPPPPQPPQPPPPFDAAIFQVAFIAAVAVVVSAMNGHVHSGSGTSAPPSHHDESHGHPMECTYKDFTNAKPQNFNGTGGVMVLRQWIEKTEAVFEICACPVGNKVKFASCTFSDRALTLWNGHVMSLTIVVANSISWGNLKIMLMKEYCPRGEVQKLEQELWSLEMVGTDISTYTGRFCDLANLCPDMVAPERKKLDRYIWGLSPQIQSSVLASRPDTFDSAKELAQSLIYHGNHRNSKFFVKDQQGGNNNKNKRKDKSSQGSSRKQQQVTVNVATVPAIASTNPIPAKPYAGNLPKCNKCNYHHHGPCREMQCLNCNKKGHTIRYCKSSARPINQVPSTGMIQACYGCGKVGHYKRNCPEAANIGTDGRILTITP
ncbi:hypothetical protein Lser_V15G43284 [Lactuca serriola]